MASDTTTLNDCGCCEGVSAKTPAAIDNRPGLSAIAYRIGTQPTFKQSLVAGLAGAPAPMRDLTTRDDDDFTIALLDAWAAVGDVLTFYQERIANENYLRTATERLSLFELARLIGYRPSPGIAAAAMLAFTVDGNAGSPQPARIPIGTKVQSVPGVDETPQTFETIEEIEARTEWNALKLKITTPQRCRIQYNRNLAGRHGQQPENRRCAGVVAASARPTQPAQSGTCAAWPACSWMPTTSAPR